MENKYSLVARKTSSFGVFISCAHRNHHRADYFNLFQYFVSKKKWCRLHHSQNDWKWFAHKWHERDVIRAEIFISNFFHIHHSDYLLAAFVGAHLSTFGCIYSRPHAKCQSRILIHTYLVMAAWVCSFIFEEWYKFDANNRCKQTRTDMWKL